MGGSCAASNGEDGRLLLERVSTEGTPFAAPAIESTGGSISHAVNGLQPHYREVIALRYLEEKSYDEISDILEMPPGTVATRIRRGLIQLKSLYMARLDGEGSGHG